MFAGCPQEDAHGAAVFDALSHASLSFWVKFQLALAWKHQIAMQPSTAECLVFGVSGRRTRYRKLKFTGTVGSNSQTTGNRIEGLGA
jgi:hypothetical protein